MRIKGTLPGAIPLVVGDNHVEAMHLERLLSLTWRKTWAVPAIRPGRQIRSVAIASRRAGRDYRFAWDLASCNIRFHDS